MDSQYQIDGSPIFQHFRSFINTIYQALLILPQYHLVLSRNHLAQCLDNLIECLLSNSQFEVSMFLKVLPMWKEAPH